MFNGLSLAVVSASNSLWFVRSDITPIEVINKVIAYAIILAFLLSLVFILFGGFKFIFSGGEETKVKNAMGTIRHAIIGLIIVLLAGLVVTLVGRIFGIDVIGELLNWNDIWNTIQGITERLSGGGAAVTAPTSSMDYNFSKGF